MDHDPKALQALITAASPPDLELEFRPMFGGIMSYTAGKVFASLSNMGLAIKMTGADHAALSVVPGVKPLRYEPDDPPSKSYLLLPDAMLSDPADIRPWIARSVAGLKPSTKTSRKKPLEDK